uniref:Olfactory receptor n=1 Tax=Cairina moschata TaxID=8855 RepID=A0A8C3CCS7_CAIMO
AEEGLLSFLLLAFADTRELQLLHFGLFLGIYLAALLGNGLILTAVACDHRLHTPMYFFLLNLAILDLGCISTTLPKAMANILWDTTAISYEGCAAQVFFLVFLVGCYLLAVMAYDRFIAICNPLLYPVIMSRRFCVLLVCMSYFMSCVNATIQTLFIFHLSFCNSIIDHFFCDVPPILKLSCSDTYITDLVHFTCATVLIISTILLILISYICIGVTIYKLKSAKGRCKAFSTCASHLTVVAIFYGTGSFMYLRPSSKYSMEYDKIISVFYTLAIPMLNPVIYSLRNKEVKEALRRTVTKLSKQNN